MLNLRDPINALPKVGTKYKFLLSNLEIFTITDLLHHFPFRYEDYAQVKKIYAIEENDTVTIKVTLERIDNIYTKFGKKITKGVVSDETGKLNIIWFNMHYLRDTMKIGETYNFSGKCTKFGNKLSMISPEFEVYKENSVNMGRLVPVYPETAGVQSKWLRTRINDVLSLVETFQEYLPENTLKRHQLKPLDTALRKIHFPDNLIEANQARRRFEFEELFLELLKVENRKAEWQIKSTAPQLETSKFMPQIQSFIGSLPFKLTDSQEDSINEILADLAQKHPMNRLLEGDVGTGKTIVAVVASYLAHLNGYKTLYMAPTELLANQHFDTFTRLLEPLGVKVVLITGSVEKTTTVDEKIKANNISIGTHALLLASKQQKNIGLVIIDEQHRFGVEQRTELVNLGHIHTRPHLLTMTATPIPRTLALTLFGDLAISTLKTNPHKDKKITTKVIPEKLRIKAYEWIKQKGEPTFIVCPLIEVSEHADFENIKAAEKEFKDLSEGVFKDVPIGLLHGRMKSKEKDEIIKKFTSGELKVLVSTPVIEVGIDIPDATIMVIESAERYGLASLHQLRGRVGRGDSPGYCLVFSTGSSRSAYERLKYLETVNNGLELAEIDLKMRGRGDIYGTLQHGFREFKVADINNLEMLENAKHEAQTIFAELDKYPLLKDKLIEIGGRSVGNN